MKGDLVSSDVGRPFVRLINLPLRRSGHLDTLRIAENFGILLVKLSG